MIDGLTGLYNERYLNNRLADEVSRAFRYKRPFSILISNVDQFRLFNRRYGTEAGNHVLREIAIIYRRNTRSSNPLCRGRKHLHPDDAGDNPRVGEDGR